MEDVRGLPRGGRTRIAPTPSGYLHAGNAVNFLLTEMLARHVGATLLLRIDDLDADRSRPEYLEDIFTSLAWLGISWDEGPTDPGDHQHKWSQTHRIDRYLGIAEQLMRAGHLYACTCSRRQHRDLTEGGRVCTCRAADLPFDGRDATWRLYVPPATRVHVPEMFGAGVKIDLAGEMGDVVLRQRDGRPAYQLASLADDVDRGISIIVRGEDLLPSTACQLHIAGLLGLDLFSNARFVHHPLVRDAAGAKLSKSAGASSLKAMREAGIGTSALRAETERRFEAVITGRI